MSAKELLKSVRTAERKYLLSKELAERTRENLYHRGVTYSDTPGSEAHDNTQEKNLAELLDLDAQAKRDKIEYFRLKKRVLDLINTLESCKEREVLIRHYFYYETWERTANRMNYSVRQIQRFHGQALEKLSQKLKDVTQCH